MIENASDMIQSVRADGSFEFVNRAWRDALGYTDEDLATMNVWELIHPEQIEHCQIAFVRAMQGVPAADSMDMLIQRLKKTKTNSEFLLSLNR